VNAKLPPATVEKLRGAFLALRADVPEHRDILQQLGKGYDGFAPARDADYDIVRELIAPFVNR
jgi:phosphonate transport system substrate-binding protein